MDDAGTLPRHMLEVRELTPEAFAPYGQVIAASSLGRAMAEMRSWLDERRCPPVLFSTKGEQVGSVLIRVASADAGDASAFRTAFGDYGAEIRSIAA